MQGRNLKRPFADTAMYQTIIGKIKFNLFTGESSLIILYIMPSVCACVRVTVSVLRRLLEKECSYSLPLKGNLKCLVSDAASLALQEFDITFNFKALRGS